MPPRETTPGVFQIVGDPWGRLPLTSKDILDIERQLRRIEQKTDDVLEAMGEYHKEEMEHTEAQTRRLLARLAGLERDNKALAAKLDTLRRMQASNVAHKRLARYSVMFFTFFSFAFVVRLFTDTVIVEPFWNDVGMLASSSFYVMSLFMKLDWKRALLRK